MSLLTQDLIERAIQLALPSVRQICAEYYWGPKGVAIAVAGKGIDDPPVVFVMPELLGPDGSIDEKWKRGRDFRDVAKSKMYMSLREGRPSWEVVNLTPWSLEHDEFLYQGGVAKDSNLAVGCSGSFGQVDEACAWIVYNCVALLCSLEIKKLQDQKVNQLKLV